MKDILDDNFINKVEINSIDDIKKRLKDAGIANFYEHRNGSIIVKESDAVKVAIRFKNGDVVIKSKFPTIGNTIQILSSAFLLFFFFFIPFIIFPFQWILAIMGGQLISYLIHMPKTKKLRSRIEMYM